MGKIIIRDDCPSEYWYSNKKGVQFNVKSCSHSELRDVEGFGSKDPIDCWKVADGEFEGNIIDKAHCNIEVSKDALGDVDYQQDAHNFLKSILPKDYEEKLHEFAKSKGYNSNEFRLFAKIIEDEISFHANIVRLKHYM